MDSPIESLRVGEFPPDQDLYSPRVDEDSGTSLTIASRITIHHYWSMELE